VLPQTSTQRSRASLINGISSLTISLVGSSRTSALRRGAKSQRPSPPLNSVGREHPDASPSQIVLSPAQRLSAYSLKLRERGWRINRSTLKSWIGRDRIGVPVSAQITGMALAIYNAASVRACAIMQPALHAPFKRSLFSRAPFSAVPEQVDFVDVNTAKERAAKLSCHSANRLKETTTTSPCAISVITPGSTTLTQGATAPNTLSQTTRTFARRNTRQGHIPSSQQPAPLRLFYPPLFVRQNRPGAVR
jgi:hypothetical protein